MLSVNYFMAICLFHQIPNLKSQQDERNHHDGLMVTRALRNTYVRLSKISSNIFQVLSVFIQCSSLTDLSSSCTPFVCFLKNDAYKRVFV